MNSYNPTNQGQPNIASTAVENKGIFNRMLRNLSNFGMKYDDMIIRNQVGIGMNEDPLSQKNNYDKFKNTAIEDEPAGKTRHHPPNTRFSSLCLV